MRTKALVCAAALAAGALASWAQSNVYSLNVVGYVNVQLPVGYSLVANPLDAGNNTVSNLFNTLAQDPDFLGSTVYAWNGSFFVANQLDPFGTGWATPTAAFPPGLGFFIQNAGTTAKTNTFVGNVMQGHLVNALPTGYKVVGSMVPQSGYVADLGLVSTPGDTIYMWNGSFFVSIQNDPFGTGWPSPVPPFTVDPVKGPFINVGQSFFYNSGDGSATWVRDFTVQ